MSHDSFLYRISEAAEKWRMKIDDRGRRQADSEIPAPQRCLMKTGRRICHIRALPALSHALNPCLPALRYCRDFLCPPHPRPTQTHAADRVPWAIVIEQEVQINSPGCANIGKSPAPSGRNLAARVNTHHPQSPSAMPREAEIGSGSQFPG